MPGKKENSRRSFRSNTNIDVEEIKTSLKNDIIVQIINDGLIELSNHYYMIDYNIVSVIKDENQK